MKTAKQVPIPISWSVKGDSSVPSLTMLVNPGNLDVTYAPVMTETRTLGGFVHEYWGEQLTTIAATGKTSLFMDSHGLTNKESRNTESYQYFMTLLNIYKNNGKGYFKTFESSAAKANQSKIESFGFITMIYDSRQYDGSFDSFSYVEDASQPFNLEYSFNFSVFRVFDRW